MIKKVEVPNNVNNLSVNQFKDVVQDMQIDTLINHHYVLNNAYTGWGKTYTTVKAINRLLLSNNDWLMVLVVVPSIKLKDDFEKTLKTINNERFKYEVIVVNSLTIYDRGIKNVDLLIIDEIHNVLGEDSQYFNTTIEKVTFKKCMGMSASLTKDQLKFLDLQFTNKGIDTIYRYELTLYWAFKNELIPQFNVYNVPVKLTNEEKGLYYEQNQIISKYQRYFAQFSIFNPFESMDYRAVARQSGLIEGSIIGMHNKWRGATTARKTIIQNSVNKLETICKILPLFKERVMVFSSKNEFADSVEQRVRGAKAYHSTLKKKEGITKVRQLEEIDINFRNGYNPYIISVGKLKEAYDVVNCSVAIRTSYTSSVKDTTQIYGRSLRFDENNPNKECMVINFVIEDFIMVGKLVKSQEKVWLYSNLKGQRYEEISLENLIEKINGRTNSSI